MKLVIHFKGEGRELTVPEPTNEEKRSLIAFAIRKKLKEKVLEEIGSPNLSRAGGIWEVVRDQVVEWSLNGYYGKEKDDVQE